jgi:hypothetical protein
MPALLNATARVRCAHGGAFLVVPHGPRTEIGGAPALNVRDLPGAVAAGCTFNAGGAPAPCSIVSVLAGACTTVVVDGAAAVNQDLVCATSSGAPTLPVADAGQVTVHGS